MFNSGFRGRRAPDNSGAISPQTKFVETKYPVPAITGWSISGSDDTALNPAGGQTVLVNGTGFVAGCAATLNGVTISPVTLVSATQISFTAPANSGGSYTLIVYNSGGGAAILVPGLTYSSVPTWTTAAGSVGSFYETTAVSTAVVATSDSALTYSLSSGSLPVGSTLYANGVITGTAPVDSGSTTYTFAVTATDAELQDVTRTFTLTINVDVVTWVTPSSGATITLDGTAYSQALSATDAAGYAVSYTANTLPTGLTLSAGTISGTPTVDGNSTSLLTATAATTNRSATNTVTWVVALNDTYFKYVTLGLSANASIQTSSFVADNSTNNAQLTVVGDTRAQNLNPYQTGYYSYQFVTRTDYVSLPATTLLTTFTGDFTFEAWVYPTDTSVTNWGIWDARQTAGSLAAMVFSLSSLASPVTGQGRLYYYNGTAYYGTGIVYYNQWSHVAYVRVGSTMTFYVNGIAGGTATISGTQTASATSNPIYIGTKDAGAASSYGNVGFISNFRIVNGLAIYTANFTPSTAPLLPVPSTVLLAAQTGRFNDASIVNSTLTAAGTTKISTAVPFTTVYQASTQYYSGSFNGSSDNLTVASSPTLTLSNGAFTVEAWIYLSGTQTTTYGYQVLGTYPAGATPNGYALVVNRSNGGPLGVVWANGTPTANKVTYGTYLNTNTWYHIAVVRTSTATNGLTIYLNGVLVATGTDATNDAVLQTLYIGSQGAGQYFPGYISNARIVKGLAVYTGNFVPATAPLAATQSSGTNTAAITQPSYSVYFSGSDQYLSVPAGTAFNLSTSDFCIEMWVYPIAQSLYGALLTLDAVDYPLMIQWASAGSANIRFYAGSASTWFSGMPLTFGTTVLNTWQHLCVTRTSGVFRVFMNGVLGATLSDATAIGDSSGNIYIGSNGTSGYASQAYISNLRFIKGSVPTGYQTSSTTAGATIFTPSTSPLTTTSQGATAANVSLLTCQSTTIIDNSLNLFAITNTGTATVASPNPFATGTVSLLTVQSPTFVDNSYNSLAITAVTTTVKPLAQSPFTPVYYSNYFGGSDYLNIAAGNTALNLGTGDFTLECWIYATSSGTSAIVDNRNPDTANAGFDLDWLTPNKIRFSTSGTAFIDSATTVSTNTWYHLALTRSSNLFKLYINGTVDSNTYTGSSTQNFTNTNFRIGSGQNGPFSGYISNLRITKGQVLYTTNFTPSTTPLTTTSQGATAGNVSLLTCQSPYFIDTSTNSFAITTSGSPRIAGIAPFVQPGGYSATAVSTYGSGYFDGTGDYLTVPYSINWSTYGSFTLELWVYFPTIAANNMTFASTGSTGYTNFYMYGSSGTYPGAIAVGIQGTNEIRSANSILAANAWYHVAYTYDGTTTKIYVNGAQVASAATAVYSNNSANLVIGNGLTNNYLSGYITDVRLVKGTVLYSSAFVPQFTTPLTAVTNTQLLTLQTCGAHNNSDFVDQSSFNNVVTRYGNATNGTFDPYGNNFSNYFNGSSYLTAPSNAGFGFGTGDFTIEGWWFFTGTISTYQRPWWFGDDNDNLEINSSVLRVGGLNQSTLITGGTTILANTWYHIALTRASGTYKLWLNGSQQGSSATNSYNSSARTFTVNATSSGGNPVTGYTSNIRVVKGTALYTASFTPSTSPLTSVANTQLLTCQSNRFADNSPNNLTMTLGSAPQVQKFSPFSTVTLPTYYSGYFDGTGDYLSVASNSALGFGTGDYTIEFWIYLTNASTTQVFFDNRNAGTGIVIFSNSGTITVNKDNSGTTIITGGSLTSTTWTQIALSRSGSSTKLFLNGTQSGSTATDSTNYPTNATYIGSSFTPSQYTTGYISNLRITKGQALYTTTFTPATTPLTTTSQGATAANVSLLTCQSNTFIDNSPNYFAITAAGDAKPRPTSPFTPTASSPVSYTPTAFGGSMYFDGTGDYLTYLLAGSGYTFSGQFTAECWFYNTGSTAERTLFVFNNAASQSYGAIRFDVDAGGSAGAVQAPISTSGSGWAAVIASSSGLYAKNTWNHVAVTRDSSNSIRVFLNGIVVASATVSGTLYTNTTQSVGACQVTTTPTNYFLGYISDVRMINGVALYTANFFPSATPATPTYTIGTNTYSSAVLLSGATGGVIDYSRTVDLETVADAKVTPFSPYAGSYYSNYLGGSANYLRVSTTANAAFGFGTGDFTIEGWFYGTTDNSTDFMIDFRGAVATAPAIFVYTSNQLALYYNGSIVYQPTSLTFTFNTWNHVALVRSSGVTKFYLNGVGAATTYTDTNNYPSAACIIGTDALAGGSSYWTGYMSNIRIVKGQALYTTNFTPSTSPLTTTSQGISTGTVSLLTCQSNRFVDNGPSAFTITATGTPKVQTQNPFALNSGISYYFDGTGDYLSMPSTPTNNFGTGNFTIEFWINPSTWYGSVYEIGGVNQYLVIYRNNSISTTKMGVRFNNNAGSDFFSTADVPTNQWSYWALVRNNGTLTWYFNGTASGTASYATSIPGGTATVGYSVSFNIIYTGYVTDLRVTNGYARYTSAFTPPTAPYKTN